MNDRYLAAAHSIQSAIAYLIGRDDAIGTSVDRRASGPKHLRVGVDIMKAEQEGLARLLMEKGVFTMEEYKEAMTAAVEREAQRYTEYARKVGGLPDTVNFG